MYWDVGFVGPGLEGIIGCRGGARIGRVTGQGARARLSLAAGLLDRVSNSAKSFPFHDFRVKNVPKNSCCNI